MKAWRRSCVGLMAVLWLSGCGGDGNDTTAEEEAQPEPATDVASEPVPEPVEVDPLQVEINASASLRSDRRLMVQGETNLPEETRLLLVVERELSGVRWQSRTSVTDGQFAAGPFGPGSGLPDGGYIITVNLVEASVQPVSVRERIGAQGEYLEGELVRSSRHGLGQVASYSRRYLIGSEPRRATDQVEVLEVE
ncbi:hypothetical protein EKK97_07580 [Billgrantia tianxiuensis]|jgi:hypothetical protein|uniref:Lipoprotein n=1 Tax=Billgrantia tianxiuensis TaxID=2497861 RepID=A0A6I6SG96_9GAMM|nr:MULTISPECIES: hypothetical protein [Halomonas]MCE8032555.1 hypothetical protein [Halomonas sp. MCCC 1A11057]QHC49509.1 hypothetical protein EKK97_07580 [Halomonas tianxiuensis]